MKEENKGEYFIKLVPECSVIIGDKTGLLHALAILTERMAEAGIDEFLIRGLTVAGIRNGKIAKLEREGK